MGQVRTMVAALIRGLPCARVHRASERRASRACRSVGTKPDATESWYGDYLPAGVEPPLAEVLADPIVHLLMRADHLTAGEVLPAVIIATTAQAGQSLEVG